MRIIVMALALFVAGTGSVAAQNAVPQKGQTLRDAKAGRLGMIDKVNADGSVQIIFNGRVVALPATTITVTENGVSTSLTKKEIGRIR